MAIDPARFGMPDATTAGVQAGVTLAPYTGPMTVTASNVVIENAIINDTLQVRGANVTIRNCLIQNWGWWGVDGEGAANLHVEHCDFIGGSGDTNAAILGSGTFIGNDIRSCENGIVLQGGASVVRDNYIHDLNDPTGSPHIDGISVQGGQNGVLIEHNTVESWDTSCIFIKNDFGPINNVTIRDNLLYSDQDRGETAATIYVDGRASGGPVTNITIESNYVEKGQWFYYSVDNANPTIQNNIEWREGVDPTPYPSAPVDHFPNAIDDSVSTALNTPVVIDALANDTLGDAPTTVSSFDSASAHGGAVAFSGGKFTYTPATDWSGTDTFHYAIQDSDGDTASAVVSVAVNPSPPPPPPPPPAPGVTLTGTSGANTLTGGAGNDTLDGKGGSDTLSGQGGDDVLIGGAGNDLMTGGAGHDKFVFVAVSDSPPGVGHRDLIYDFHQGEDRIDLSSIDAKSNLSGNQAFTFLGEGTFTSADSKVPGQVKYHYETAADGTDRTVIEGTVNTSAGVDFQVSLVGHHVLTHDDFIL